jgi:hypothetical protein
VEDTKALSEAVRRFEAAYARFRASRDAAYEDIIEQDDTRSFTDPHATNPDHEIAGALRRQASDHLVAILTQMHRRYVKRGNVLYAKIYDRDWQGGKSWFIRRVDMDPDAGWVIHLDDDHGD